jgi:hypothetical protein
VLPAQLVKFRIGMFIQEVLDPFRVHISKFWLVEKIDIIEDEHRDLLKVYNSNSILKTTIDKQDHQISFNPGWDVLPASQFDSLHAFVGGWPSCSLTQHQSNLNFRSLNGRWTKIRPL